MYSAVWKHIFRRDTRFHMRPTMGSSKDSLLKKYVEIGLVVSSYWVVSISLVFINKYLLSGNDLKLDAPLFVTWFQCVVTVVLCITLTALSKLIHSVFGRHLFQFGAFGISIHDLKQVLPVSTVFVAMITFNNLCLKYVDVSFYYIGRSLTTVFNVILSYIILRQKTSSRSLICCGVIIGGFFLGVDQETVSGSLSVLGITFGVLASLFVALNSIYIKKVLNVVQGDVSLLTYYNNINACLLFPPLMLLFGERHNILHFEHYGSLWFWGPMILGGVFGFAIGYLTSLQVKVTSPLTNNISGTAKACAQTVIASIYYHEIRPFLWWVSNMVVLLGSAFYTWVKQREMVATSNKQQATTNEDVEDLKPLVINEEDNYLPSKIVT